MWFVSKCYFLTLTTFWVEAVKKAVAVGKELSISGTTGANGMHREPLRLPDSHQPDGSNHYRDNDDFIASESDRHSSFLIK